jgi:hypothetical protein
MIAAATVFLGGTSAAGAQPTLAGTWKFDTSSAQMPTKPDVYLLKGGMFTCSTCTPPYTVAADGAPHAVAGSPYHDQVAVKLSDPTTLEQTFYKAGRVVGSGRDQLGPDGKTATITFTDASNTSSAPVTGKVNIVRVAEGPAGSSPFSGAWRTAKIDTLSANDLLITYDIHDGMLSMSEPTGQSYMAKLDGAVAPFKGDPGVDAVSVKMTGPGAYQETDMRAGKVIGVGTMTLAPDGKSLAVTYEDKLAGTSSAITAYRQ